MFNKLFPVLCIGFVFINLCWGNSGDSQKSLFDELPLNGAIIPPGSLSVAYTSPSTPTNVSIVSEKNFRRRHNGFVKGKVLNDPEPTSLFDDLPNQGAILPSHSTRRTRLKIPKSKIDSGGESFGGESKNRNVRGNLGSINLDDFHVEESPVSEFDLFFNRDIAPSLARSFLTAGSGSNSRRIPIITAPVIPRIIHPVRTDEELIRSTLLKAAGGNNGKTVVFFAGENEKEKVGYGGGGGGAKYSTTSTTSVQKSSPARDSGNNDKKEVHYHYYFANKEEATRHHHGQHGQHGSSNHQQGSVSTSTTSRPDGGFFDNNNNNNNGNNNGNSPGTSYGSPSPTPDSSYGASSGKRSFASRYDNSRRFVIGSSINVPLSIGRRTATTPSTFYNAPSRIAPPDQTYGRIAPPEQNSYGRIATEPPNNSYGSPQQQPSFDDPTTEFPIVQQHHNQQQQQGGYGNNNNNQGGYNNGNNNNNQGGSNNNNQGGYSNNNNQQQGSNQGNNGGGNGNGNGNGNGGYSNNNGQQQGGYNDFTSRTLFTFRNSKKEQQYDQQDDDLDSYSAPAPPSDSYSAPQQDDTYKQSYGPPPKEPYGPPAKHTTTTTTTTTTPAPPRDVESQQQLTQITIETIPITHSVTRLVTVPKIVQSFQSNGDVPISSLPAPDDPSQHFEAPQNQYGPPAPPPSSSSSDGKYSNNRGNTASTLSLEHAQLFSQLLNNARDESNFGDTSYSSNGGIDLESLQGLLGRGRNRNHHDDISLSDLQQLALLGQTRGILQSPGHSHSQQHLTSNGLIRASQLLNTQQQFGRFGSFPGGTRTRDTLLTGDAIDALNDLLREQRLQSSVSELRSKLRQENREKIEKTRQTHRNLFYKGAVLLGALTLLPRVAPLATSAATAAATAAASSPIGSNLLLPLLIPGVGKRRKRSVINRKNSPQRQKILPPPPPSPFELCLLEGVENGNRPKTSKISKPGYFKNWIKCTGQFALSKLPFLNPPPGVGQRKGNNRDREISESMKWKLLSFMPSKDILLNKNCLQKHFCQNLLEVETLDNWESYLMLYSLFAGDVNRNPWIKNSMKAAKDGNCGVFICTHDFSYKDL